MTVPTHCVSLLVGRHKCVTIRVGGNINIRVYLFSVLEEASNYCPTAAGCWLINKVRRNVLL